MAGNLAEEAAQTFGEELDVGVIGPRTDAAPVVVLVVVARRAVLDLGEAQAGQQLVVIVQAVGAAGLELIHGLVGHVVDELRAGQLQLAAVQRRRRQTQQRQLLVVVGHRIALIKQAQVHRRVGAEGTVRLGGGRGVVRIHVDGQRIADLPCRVEAGRAEPGLLAIDAGVDRQVVVVGREQRRLDQWRGHRATRERGRAEREVEPAGELGVLLVQGVRCNRVVQRETQILARSELQRELAVEPLALDGGQRIAHVDRGRIQARRTVGDRVGTGRGLGRDGAPVAGRGGEGSPAALRVGIVGAGFPLGVAAADRDADGAVGKGLAVDARDFRGHLAALQGCGQSVVGVVEVGLDADARDAIAQVQRAGGSDIDRCADAARGRLGAAGLVDLQRRDRIGRQVGEVECPRAARAAVQLADRRRRHLPAVQQHHVEVGADAAHGDLGSLAAGRAIDGHTGDALHRFREVGVGELADVLGHDAIHQATRLPLEGDSAVKRLANARDDHGPQVLRGGRGVRLLRLGLRGRRAGQQRKRGRKGHRLEWPSPPGPAPLLGNLRVFHLSP
mmetsp:Transcript_30750/g.56613  ORF Transcript_30750/g.56613 Transcript_30750/m.56613 type:complete len:561 (+) Transcript_30750:2306-3988(+)